MNTAPLADAGIDSFALVELLLHCERAFGIRVPESHLTHHNLVSVATLAACIFELARGSHSPPGATRWPLPMPDLPRQIRLAAGDYFMHGQDRRMRRAGMLGNGAASRSGWKPASM